MRRAIEIAVAALVGGVVLGCAGDPDQIGAAEPFRVRDAQFLRTLLPGRAPKKNAATTTVGANVATAKGPRITAQMSLNSVVIQGQGGKAFAGRATKNGVALGVALRGVSDGYWVLPTGTIDPPTNELTWSIVSDFDRNIVPGSYDLLLVAIDDQGVAGEQVALTLCVDSRVPDNLKACDAKRPLPKAVISLSWDANADLDLQVVAPGGDVTDSKHPTTVPPDDMGMLPDDVGVLDRDSNAGCAIDGIRSENLVFSDVKPSGLYGIYVNLFDACKQPTVRFRVGIYTAVTKDDGSEHFQQWFARGGELLELSANGGSARGLFVTQFKFD